MKTRVRLVLIVVGAGVGWALVGSQTKARIPGYRVDRVGVVSEPADPEPTLPEDEMEAVIMADDADVPLVDDLLQDKNPTFDPSVVDRRPHGDWQVNASGAVVRLNPPHLFDESAGDRPLLPSYAVALGQGGTARLASINLIDGKAKQFDDGLYAAIDRAYYTGDPALGAAIEGHRALLGRLRERVAPGSAAADWLAAGLSLDSTHPPTGKLSQPARRLADQFTSNEAQSKPIGFYTWDATLGDCFRVLRFCSQPLPEPVVAELARVLRADADLLARYTQASSFYGRLTNPLDGRTLTDFATDPDLKFTPGMKVMLFPPSTSREGELFRQLFPTGPPPDAQLMRALVMAIRSGTVDLAPDARSGWYEYQAFALEPMLLPERGQGADHLLLTRDYKKRLLVAFEALLTKRRETHARQLPMAVGAMARAHLPATVPPLAPRLRLEPNPSYYLRTARSYAFVADLLAATFGAPALQAIHGLTATGPRPSSLGAEVRAMRDLFLGFALLSSEDIGHRLDLTPAEIDRQGPAEAAATAWLDQVAANPGADPDLAADTRVAIPIGMNPQTRKVRLWATIGVSMTSLKVDYARPPRVRPAAGGDWRPLRPTETEASFRSIAVDEFAEIELDGGRVLNRAELRAICDTHKTRDAIRQALGALK